MYLNRILYFGLQLETECATQSIDNAHYYKDKIAH